MDPFLPDDTKLEAIRALLPSLVSGIRLDTTIAGPFPAETDRAVRQLEEHELRVGRGGPDRAEELAQHADEAASVLAAVLSARPDQMVLAPGPVGALSAALVARGPATEGRVAVMGELPERLDAAVVAVASAHGRSLVRTVSSVPPDTALAVAAHVDPVTGRVQETHALADRAHAAGASLLLDMGWSAGAIAVDAPGSGADLVLVDAHRWLLGPEGVTGLWASDPAAAGRLRELLDRLPRAQLMGVARSVGWLLMYVGLPWAFGRADALAARLRAGLAAAAGVEVRADLGGMATTVPIAIAGWSAGEVAAELVRRVHAQVDVDAARDLALASVGAWLREDEIDRFIGAVTEIAAHTPGTMPRRPLLTVLSAASGDER